MGAMWGCGRGAHERGDEGPELRSGLAASQQSRRSVEVAIHEEGVHIGFVAVRCAVGVDEVNVAVSVTGVADFLA